MTKPQEVARLHDAPLAISDPGSILQVIERAAKDPSIDVQKMERLMAMAERLGARQAEQAYNEAMNAAQEEMRPVSQDASNPQTRSKYASFAALDKALRPIYTKHGFSLSFDTGDGAAEGYVRVICKAAHRAGHCERPRLDMPADGKGAKGGDVMTKTHATMSALSYAKRGLLKMVFNIAEGEEDDDGNKGGSGDKITEQQVALIRSLLDETGSDIEKFCAFLKVEAVPDIAAKDYEKALSALNAKKTRRA